MVTLVSEVVAAVAVAEAAEVVVAARAE